ncbi:MAG: hypothetical protein QOF89_2348 [Acidobacteriota bacterium]|jgi:hypothetical protein|nr:hypothetical protein [Acidobacteriota bacterium]
MTWYFVKDGMQQGPVSDDQIRRMAQDGSLQREDLVWREGMAAWQPASEAGVEFSASPGALQPPPPPPQYVAPPPAPYSPYSPYSPSPELAPGAAAIPDYLPWSIAATILCCLPLGIVAIVFSAKANNAKAAGDLRTAAEAANQAKIWLYVSAGIGLVVGLIYCVGILASLAGKT